MAQEDIVSGVFGITPEMYQAGQTQRDIAEQQAAQESAGKGLFASAYAPQIQQQAQLNARALGGLLGVEDPQLQMIREVSNIRNQFDITTPEGMKGFAQAIAPKYPQLAVKAVEKSNTMMETGAKAETAKQKIDQEKKLREALSGLGDNPTDEEYLKVFRQFGNPDQQAKAIEMSIARKTKLSGAGVGRQEIVSNNGVQAGYVDAKGNFFNNQGRKVSSREFEDSQKSHDAASNLLYKLQNITEADINNAYGSMADYTTMTGGKLVGPTETLNAQTKINEVGIRSVLNNLSQLKGASSDKEMAQMIKDFPGYQAEPKVMKEWMDRAVKTTNRFLQTSEKRYGFDTDYAPEGRFTNAVKETKGAVQQGAPDYAALAKAERERRANKNK